MIIYTENLTTLFITDFQNQILILLPPKSMAQFLELTRTLPALFIQIRCSINSVYLRKYFSTELLYLLGCTRGN